MLSFEQKVSRANDHLTRLEADVKAFHELRPYKLVSEPDALSGHQVIRLQISPALPQNWSLDAGEILYLLRSALDHLAFHLATSAKGSQLNESEARSVAFPIRDCCPESRDWERWLPYVHPNAISFIEGLQPYWHEDPRENVLLCVAGLNNIDKHRSLNVIAISSPGWEFKVNPKPDYLSVIDFPARLEEGSEVARVMSSTDLKFDYDIQMAETFDEPDVMPEFVVPFDQGLRACYRHISENIIAPLRRFL